MAITIGRGNQQIREEDIGKALDERIYARMGRGDRWVFPKTKPNANGVQDGCIGKLCVSEFVGEYAAGATQALAVHVTFSVESIFVPSEGTVGSSQKIRAVIKNLHFTARPKGMQLRISGDNFVAATPSQRAAATHRGKTNDWLHNNRQSPKCADLAIELGLPADTPEKLETARRHINAALTPYNGAALEAVETAIATALQHQINENLIIPNEEELHKQERLATPGQWVEVKFS